MTPHFQSANVTIFNGDCLEVLRTLPDESVHCCVTSPPYWGLRDYGTAKWEGGSAECDHKGNALCSDRSGLAGYSSENIKLRTNCVPFKDICGKCGAIRIDSQLGLERTPEEYIAKMVSVFAEVNRVLRDDGTLWLNMGDSYNGSGKGGVFSEASAKQATNVGANINRPTRLDSLKPKDLIGIPWMLAFALRADGWYLRSDIIWSKPNPMPESVTDRPTKAHEYIFLLAKSERYYYDADLIREPHQDTNVVDGIYQGGGVSRVDYIPQTQGFNGGGIKMRDRNYNPAGRNKRTVWEVATQSFPEAHFATFPEELIKPCILAGCPAGGTVLDPFFGSGTTGLVAQTNGCKAIGIELNASYIEIAKRRLRQEVLEFAPC